MTGSGLFLSGQEVNTWEWVVPWLVAMACIAVFGLAVQQLLLRWNQGQDLRQALITIAVSVIVADQVIAHFPRTVPLGTQKYGGNAVDHLLARLDESPRRPPHRRCPVLARAARHARARGLRRRRALALAAEDADRDGHPRGRRRPADDLGARDQHPVDLRDRVPRRLRARGLRRCRQRLAVVRRPGPGRPVAPLLARGRDHRRHGLARGRGRRGRALRARLLVRRRVPADHGQRLLHSSTPSSSRSRSWRWCSRSARRGCSGGSREPRAHEGRHRAPHRRRARSSSRSSRRRSSARSGSTRSSPRRSSSGSAPRASSSSRRTAG